MADRVGEAEIFAREQWKVLALGAEDRAFTDWLAATFGFDAG
jgi:hypothetical protein